MLLVVFLSLTIPQILAGMGKLHLHREGQVYNPGNLGFWKVTELYQTVCAQEHHFRPVRQEEDFMPARWAELNQHHESGTIRAEQMNLEIMDWSNSTVHEITSKNSIY